MWTPPLRESFAFPICIAQLLLVTLATRTSQMNPIKALQIGLASCSFILFWQFAQFALLTQVAALFAIYLLGILNRGALLTILSGHLVKQIKLKI